MCAARDVQIQPYAQVAAGGDPSTMLDAIFFEASATRCFVDANERAAFRERWLGRYLLHFLSDAFLAVAANGDIVGYVVGCLDDPAGNPLFSDIDYFETFAHQTTRYPAHLHINVDADTRSAGVGARLLTRFVAHAASAGSPGVHVVTGMKSRNVRFYNRQGFVERGRHKSNDTGIVFLARKLEAGAARDI